MPKKVITPPQVEPQPAPTVTVVNPTVQNYDLDALFPPTTVTNSALPDPNALNKVAPPSRQFVLRTPKPGDPLPYAMGRTIIKPSLLNADDSGENLVLDLMWGVGPMQRVANGIVPSIDDPNTWDHSIRFLDIGLVLISGSQFEHFTGTPGQPASSIMTALKGSYPSYPNIAHSVITMQPGWNLNISGVCDAVMVLDPRVSFSTVTWTRNPALILADMVIRCGYTVDWDSVADAADYCDELIGDTGAEIERWKISGVIYDRADLRSWIRAMQQYAHCFVDKVGSTIFLRPDKPRSPNHTVTKDDIVKRSARMRTRSMRNTVEGVRVTFNFQFTTLDAEIGAFDDPGTVTQLRMPFWAGSFPYLGSHAQRHAEEVFNKSQLEIEDFEFVTFDKGLERTVGDVGTITYAPLNLVDREMALVEMKQESRGRWRLRYTDHSNDVFPETNYDDLVFNQTEIQNPYAPVDGPEPDLNWEYNEDTSPQPILTLTWTGVTWAYVKDYDVRVFAVGSPEEIVYNSEDDGYVVHQSGVLFVDLSDHPVEFGRTYQADIYVRSIVNAIGSVPGTDTVDVIELDNLIISSRDLTHTSWSTFGSGMTVTFDQIGIDDGSNMASNVDDSWTDDTTSSGVSTEASLADVSTTGWGTFRIWVKKDATASQGALLYLPFYTNDYGTVSDLDVVFSPDTGDFYTTVYNGTVNVEVRSSTYDSDWWEILVEFQIPTDAAARFEPEIAPAFIDPYEESPTLPQAVAGNIVVGNVEFFAEVRLTNVPNGTAPVYNDTT